MTAGKPRIAANFDGILTVINDGVDGPLIESENISDLAEKLDMLMGNPELRESLRSNVQKRALANLTKEIYFNNVTSFYNEPLSN